MTARYDNETFAWEIALPEEQGRFINPNRIQDFVTEFFEMPGSFQAFAWDFAYLEDGQPAWRPIDQFQVCYQPVPGRNVGSGARVGTYQGRKVLEFSNDRTDTYAQLNDTLSILDSPPCNYSLGASQASALAGGQTGSVVVLTGSACNVVATPSESWLTVTGGAPATGSTSVLFTAAPNTGPARSATINVGGSIFTVNQAAFQGTSVPQVTSVSPVSATGASMTRTFVFTDADGADDIGVVNVLVNFYLDGTNACYFAYDNQANRAYLVQDGDAGLQSLALPSAGTLANSQCSIPASSISGVRSGSTRSRSCQPIRCPSI